MPEIGSLRIFFYIINHATSLYTSNHQRSGLSHKSRLHEIIIHVYRFPRHFHTRQLARAGNARLRLRVKPSFLAMGKRDRKGQTFWFASFFGLDESIRLPQYLRRSAWQMGWLVGAEGVASHLPAYTSKRRTLKSY